MQGDQQGAKLEAAQVGCCAIRTLALGQAGLGFGEVDGGAVVLIVIVPRQKARQVGQWRQRPEEQGAFAVAEVERVAECQQEHLLVEPAQGIRRGGTEGRGHRLAQAVLVFAYPIQ
ncbi:hypothetical protein D3C76_1592370 [compost metagenome]